MRKLKDVGRAGFVLFFLSVSSLVFFSGSREVSASCNCPADVLDLTNWKQTLPTGSGKPTEIKQPALANYSTSPYFQALSGCDGVKFRAPVNGATTSNSGYPRSELREMASGGTSQASWSTSAGTHIMYIDQAITSVPKNKQHVVAGQVHDADDDVIVIRLEYPKLFIDINGDDGPVLDPNYQLGKRFTVKFVAGSGQIRIFYNGSDTPAYTLKKSTSGCYFKAGAYTQSNCTKESDCSENNFGEVEVYKLLVGHSNSNAEPELAVGTNPVDPGPAPTDVNEEESDKLTFEAEKGNVVKPMKIVKNASALGGKYVVQKKGGKRGIIKYPITVPKSGKYQLSARVITPNGASNSVFYSMDAGKIKKWHFPKKKNWAWSKGPVLNLGQGEHTLIIKKREKNTRLDSFELKGFGE